jgi:hypothetical protein
MAEQKEKKRSRGRPPGSVNIVTRDVRELIHQFLAKRMSNIDKVFDNLSERDQVRYIIELLGYVIPKAVEKEHHQEDSSFTFYEMINKQLQKKNQNEKN